MNEGLSAELERIKHSEVWKAEADIKSRDALMALTTEKMTTVAELDKIKVAFANAPNPNPKMNLTNPNPT